MDHRVGGAADLDDHLALNRINPGDEFAEHHDDDARMDEDDAGAVPGQLEANRMGGEQIDQHGGADRPAAGERDLNLRGFEGVEEDNFQRHPDEEAAEVFCTTVRRRYRPGRACPRRR